jgi:hypothetical protein
MDDWHLIVTMAKALGVDLGYGSAADVRADIAKAYGGDIAAIAFGRPTPARHWLQGSNPSERWKWDFLFQDLPPVKGTVDPTALPLPPGSIPLKRIP